VATTGESQEPVGAAEAEEFDGGAGGLIILAAAAGILATGLLGVFVRRERRG
jgi:hypothetical protein